MLCLFFHYGEGGLSIMNYVLLPKLSQLKASNCGIAILKTGWIHPSRTLKSSVLILGKKGKAEIKEEDETLYVEPDTFTLLSSGKHHEGSKPIGDATSYFWMHFETIEPPQIISSDYAVSILEDPKALSSTLQDSLLLPQNITLKDSKSFLDMFHDLLYIQERPSFISIKLQLLFKLMLINLNESALSQKINNKYDTTRYSVIYAVIQKIHENYTDINFSVKVLSEILHYNADYIGRIFKDRMGRSISDYITDQRIKYAVTLLVESTATIEKIAYACGFYSVRNFLRQFKSRKTETPSELRQRYRTMHITNR